MGANSHANPVWRSQRVGLDKARSARGTGAGATDALTGAGTCGSSTTVVKEEDPALNNRGPLASHGSPALPESGPREDELQGICLGGPVVPPKGAAAFPYPALSTSGPRVGRIASREQEGREETSTVSEARLHHQIDVYDETDVGDVSSKFRADDVPLLPPPPMPFRHFSSLSTAVARPGLKYAAAVCKAVEIAPASAVQRGGCYRENKQRRRGAVSRAPQHRVVPRRPGGQGMNGSGCICDDVGIGVKFLIKKCVPTGIALLLSGACVATAAGPGGAIAPIGAQPPVEAYARTVPFRSLMYHDDVKLAKTLQEEEFEGVARAAARTHQDVQRDAEVAASIEDEYINEVTSLAPAYLSAAPKLNSRTTQEFGATDCGIR